MKRKSSRPLSNTGVCGEPPSHTQLKAASESAPFLKDDPSYIALASVGGEPSITDEKNQLRLLLEEDAARPPSAGSSLQIFRLPAYSGFQGPHAAALRRPESGGGIRRQRTHSRRATTCGTAQTATPACPNRS